MDPSAGDGYPPKSQEAIQQPPPPQTGGPPPPYSQAYTGAPPPSGYVQSPYPGQPVLQQPGTYPGQPIPQQTAQYGYPAATTVVVQQPRSVTHMAPQRPPQSYMVISIIGCLCCFWPLGIGAIIASCNVQSAIGRGDYASANSSSQTAKIVNMINFILGLIIIVIVIILTQTVWTAGTIYY